MKPAEFRCAREFLGLSANWVAVKLDVGPWTVNGWEQPGHNVPDYGSNFMVEELDKACQAVDQLVEMATLSTLMVPVDNRRHEDYPPSYKRMIASRVADRTGVGIDYE